MQTPCCSCGAAIEKTVEVVDLHEGVDGAASVGHVSKPGLGMFADTEYSVLSAQLDSVMSQFRDK